jgi:hypothetical protein
MAGGSEERLGFNEAAFRSVNAAIEAGTDADRLTLVCECGRLGCNRLIQISRSEYEAVRAHPRRFFLLPDHTLLAVEKVGEAGDAAARTDPRQDDD